MMPGVRYPEASQQHHAGMKRALPDDPHHTQAPPKRRRVVHHGLRHKQTWHADPTLAPQDELFFQSQILRSISVGLTAAGFDGAKPTALEAFRAQVDAFMHHFLSDVRSSMHLARRTSPTPQDFTFALARSGYSSSDLEPQTVLRIPPSITQLPIPPPPPQEDPPPELEGVLGHELSGAVEKASRSYIPAHLPSFPSKHTWQSTPVFSSRETDPRKIRERATQEGVLAEQALRKLMAANRSGRPTRRVEGGGGGSRALGKKSQVPKSREMWEEAMRDVIQEDEMGTERGGLFLGGLDGAQDEKPKDIVVDSGLLVNYDQKYWRKGTQAAAWS